MSELSFEQMLEESLKTIRTGEVVTGKVIDVKEDEIVLNIGYKSDGIITRSEYTNESNVDLRNLVHVGDEMEAKVVKVNDGEGQVALSYKRLAADRGNKRLEEAFENHEVLTAKVSQVLDGGLSVIVDEARIFIPARPSCRRGRDATASSHVLRSRAACGASPWSTSTTRAPRLSNEDS